MSSLPLHMIRGKMTALFPTAESSVSFTSPVCTLSVMVVKAVQYLRVGMA